MSAYLMADVRWRQNGSESEVADYRRRADETIGAFGGRYLIRGGKLVVVEGSWQPHRVVLR